MDRERPFPVAGTSCWLIRSLAWRPVILALWILCLAHRPALQAAATPAPPAASSYVIDAWGTDEGLPQNSVTSIVQTRDGYLWCGTLNGLVRFDGTRFVVLDESNAPGLNSSRIVHLFEDSRGVLWIGTETAGVATLENGRITSLGIGRGTSEQRLVAAAEDDRGSVWLYTADGQLWRHRNGKLDIFVFDLRRPSPTRALVAEPGGLVWIGTDRRLAAVMPDVAAGSLELPVALEAPVDRLDYLLASSKGGYWRLANGQIQRCVRQEVILEWGSNPWGSAPVAAACEDREGNLLVGTLGVGVFWFDPQGRFAWLTTGHGLTHDIILSLHVDREGTLWIGTDGGGLNRVKRPVFERLDRARGLQPKVIQSVCEDAQGGLWIGSNGGGAACWKDGALLSYGAAQGLANSHVWSVYADRSSNIWAGTRGGGLFLKRGDRFEPAPGAQAIPPEVFAIHEDRRGTLWLGTRNGLLRKENDSWKSHTTRDGLSADEIRAITDSPEGALWIGTFGGGLNRIENGTFTAFHKSDGLPSEDISSLYLDAEGVLWIGTFGSGLGRYHQGQWTRYTAREGLPGNSIGSIIEDGQGCLWIASTAGILRVRKQDLDDFARGSIGYVPGRVYGKPDGLPTRECTLGSQPGAALTRSGQLWFPTVQGLAFVHLDRLDPNPHPPPVIIESISIDGQIQGGSHLLASPSDTIVVPAGRHRIDIHYSSLNLRAPDRARFQYRLDGFETGWTEAGSSRTAHYPRLPPGQYRFIVKACNEDGIWNETGRGLAIIVLPPLWRKWWFLTIATGSLLAAIVGMVYYFSTQRLQRQLQRLEQKQAVEKERSRIAQDIHDQLGANLTQVSLLSDLIENDKEQPAEVEAHARQISLTARETTRVLDEIVWAVNPSNDTLEGLVSYLCKYAQEYLSVASLRCRLDVPTELPASSLPPELRHNVFLSFKEAITNVVRHASASIVQVRLRLDPGRFAMEIEDNGRGLAGLDPAAAQTRNGLQNMRRRMTAIGGSFSIEPAPQGGALVRLSAPLGPPSNPA